MYIVKSLIKHIYMYNRKQIKISTSYRSRRERLSLGELDKGDVGVRDSLADEVLGTIASGTAVIGEGGSSDIGDPDETISNYHG